MAQGKLQKSPIKPGKTYGTSSVMKPMKIKAMKPMMKKAARGR